jgi:hypothetical protein
VRCGLSLGRSCLDILRTVAEDLLGPDLDRIQARIAHSPVDAEPASPLRIEHEDADRPIA